MKKNKENELDYENDIRDIGDELEEEIKNGTPLNEIPFIMNDRIFKLIIYAMKKYKKKNQDILLISHYLTSFSSLMKMIMKKRTLRSVDFLNKISVSLVLEQFYKNNIIFRLGDTGDKFYLILKGNVSVLIKQEKKVKMTRYEYISYLKYLDTINEKGLQEIIIESNKIDFSRFEIEPYLNNKIQLEKNDIEKEITYQHKKNLELCNPNEYIDRVTPIINDNEKAEKQDIILWTYLHIISLKCGETFGEVALGGDFKRTATIISNEDCLLGSISKGVYDNCIKDIQDRIRKDNINVILSNEILSGIKYETFEKEYFNRFVERKFIQGTMIFEQNEQRKEILFLKTGEIEISTKMSMNELNSLIVYKGGKINDKQMNKSIDDKNSIEQHFYMQKEQNFRVFQIDNKGEIVGLDNYVNDHNKYFCTAKCKSKSVEGYAIEIEAFNEILAQQPRTYKKMNSYVKEKNDFLVERLLSMRKVFLNKQISSYRKELSAIIQGSQNTRSKLKNIGLLCQLKKDLEKKKNFVNKKIPLSPPQMQNKKLISIFSSPSINMYKGVKPKHKIRTTNNSVNANSSVGSIPNNNNASQNEDSSAYTIHKRRKRKCFSMNSSINANANSSNSNNLCNIDSSISHKTITKRIILPFSINNKESLNCGKQKKVKEIKLKLLSSSYKPLEKTQKRFVDNILNKMSKYSSPFRSNMKLVPISKNNTLVLSTIDFLAIDKVAESIGGNKESDNVNKRKKNVIVNMKRFISVKD